MRRLIDADALIKWVQECGAKCPTLSVEKLFNAIKDAPTIDPSENGGCWGCCCEKLGQVKNGKWIKLYDKNYKCSCCGAWWTVDRDSTIKDFHYCPDCGAMMERSEDVPV